MRYLVPIVFVVACSSAASGAGDSGADAYDSATDQECAYRSEILLQGVHTDTSLPSGACGGAHDCLYAIGHECRGALGRVDKVECVCAHEIWACGVITPGATVCSQDASPD